MTLLRTLIVLLSCSLAGAQDPVIELDWSTIEPGARLMSDDETIELTGTLGQADASGVLSGGGIELVGGFWAAVLNESTPFVWMNDGTGDFNGDNWGGGIPDDLDTVTFALDDLLYTVNFPRSVFAGRAEVLDGDTIFFNFDDTFLTLQGSEETDDPSVIVSASTGDSMLLFIENTGAGVGGIVALDVSIARECDGTAEVIVTQPTTRFEHTGDIVIGDGGHGCFRVTEGAIAETASGDVIIGVGSVACPLGTSGAAVVQLGAMWAVMDGGEFVVGRAGVGALVVEGGGVLTTSTSDILIGDQPGSAGSVIVRNADSMWTDPAASVTVGNEGIGQLIVESGGMVEFTLVVVGPLGEISGIGTIDASLVRSAGVVRPGEHGAKGIAGTDTVGTLTIDGMYRQQFMEGDQERTGNAVFRFVKDEANMIVHDTLVVTGDAELGGGLFIEFGPEVARDAAGSFEIVTSTMLDIGEPFDVGFYPGLDGRVMQVCLNAGCPGGAGAGPGGGSVNITIQNLEDFLDFGGDSDAVNEPVDAILGDFDGDDLADLAVAVAGDPGHLFVLLNGGNDADPNVFSGDVRDITLEADPVGLTAGYFDGDDTLDIAVASTDVAPHVELLRNIDGGMMNPTSHLEALTFQPAAIGRGDMNGAAGNVPDPQVPNVFDLVVASADDDSVHVFVNLELGDGDFEPVDGPAMSGGEGPGSANPTDLDNDKDLDLAVVYASGVVAIFENPGDGDFSGALVDEIPVGLNPVDLVAADLDEPGERDPFPELVTANAGDGTVSIIVNDTEPLGPINMAPAVSVPTVPFGQETGEPLASPQSLVVTDLDEDGDNDIVVAATDDLVPPTELQVLRNDLNDGEQIIFAPDPGALPVGANPFLVLAGDVDDDTDPDVVSISQSGGGGAAAGMSPLDVLVNNQLLPCPADTDGDGEVDVVDLTAVILAWGTSDRDADINDDGTVNVQDLSLVVLNWGPCDS